MKYYLSSFKLGNETSKLKDLVSKTNKKFGYIPNAIDFTSADPVRKFKHIEDDMNDIRQYGVEIEVLDLKNYFGKKEVLKTKLGTLGGLYVSGGNTFVLRQAVHLSGLEEIFTDLQSREDFVYVAYSAGVCILTPTLKPYAITDDANDYPYKELKSQIWEGLGILDFAFEPHYNSDHPESKSTDIEIQHCIDNKILFKAYRDGEVLILE
jgi:dipeptidase E